MAAIFRAHLNDTGFNAALNNAMVNFTTELAATLPGGGGNLGQVTLDSTGVVSIQSTNPTISATLAAAIPANVVSNDNLGALQVETNNLTIPALVQELSTVQFSGAVIQRDI